MNVTPNRNRKQQDTNEKIKPKLIKKKLKSIQKNIKLLQDSLEKNNFYQKDVKIIRKQQLIQSIS